MKQISNQTLASLLVLAIVISLGGTYFSLNKLNQLTHGEFLTGYAGTNFTQGLVNLSINDVTAINFSINYVDWGSGRVGPGCPNCSMDTLGNTQACCNGFNTVSTGLRIRNIGNNAVNLSVSSTKNASLFIGGTNPRLLFYFQNSSAAPGCAGGSLNYTSGGAPPDYPGWWNLSMNNLAGSNQTICSGMNYTVNNNQIDMMFNVTIPQDAHLGAKSATIFAIGLTVP